MLIYFKNLIKLQLLAISLPFSCFYLKNFPSWIRIQEVPGGKMNADPDPQPWLGPKRTTVVVRIRIQIIMNEKSLYIKSEYLTVKSERLID